MIELALVVAAGSLISGLVLAFLLRRAPTVSLQLAGLALIAVCVPLAAVLLSGWVMFHMGADVKILAVAAGSATAAVFAALVLARSITGSLGRVGSASRSLAAGELSTRAPVGGPREIAELATSFNAMAAALEQLFDARRELVAWASHDLRAPIASMQAMLEAIEDGLASADDYLPTLREQVRTLSALVDDLFELARIDAGVLTLELRQVPVAPLVASALRLLQPEAEARGVALSADRRREGRGAAGSGQVRTRPLQPPHERAAPHAVGRLGRGPRRAARLRPATARGGQRRGPAGGSTGADVRALLAGGSRAERQRSRPRAGDRTRSRRGARRPHLGREPPAGRRLRLVHAAGGVVSATPRRSRPKAARRPRRESRLRASARSSRYAAAP